MSATLAISPSGRAIRVLCAVVAVCAAVAVVGLFVDPRETWGGYLVGFAFFMGLALAGPLFLAIHNLSGARWSAPLLPIAEGMTLMLPVAALLGFALIGGIPSLYEWAHPEAVAADELLRHKSPWLNVGGFAIRLALFFGLWIWLGSRLVGTSPPGEAGRQSRIRRSALYMAVFGITFSLAVVDWFQSLEPHWFSTVYALTGLAGIASSGLALLMIVAALRVSAAGPRLPGGDDRLDDLGKLALALSLFWAYVAFCQSMLIWYTNSPEETPWYEIRQAGGWRALGVVNSVLNFLVPFLVLMPRKARRSATVVFRVAIVMLLGRLVDLFVAIMPPLSAGGPRIGAFDSAAILGCVALFALWFVRVFSKVVETSHSGGTDGALVRRP